MKTTALYVFILSLGLVFVPALKGQNIGSEDFLNGIQAKIDKAFYQSLKNNDASELKGISEQLDKLNANKGNKLVKYWKSYCDYNLSICYSQLKEEKKAEKAIFEAIDKLKKMEGKNTEDYALLACEQSYSCQFRPGIVIPFVAEKLKSNCQLAIEADSLNLRAYYVLGSHDFYTPEMYGGGKEVEQMLLKAISLSSQKIKNPYLPSWGKQNAYELLIRWYVRKEKWALAQKYYEEGVRLFPESYLIKKLKEKLVQE
ncbi:hypothetical protein [Marinifilum flexuosum]|uniref:hypothetical protein n=1 Tax=Marinifilum flexuosum TaxID=1117708 RepID=UPI0024942B79|nr:hypothetical protein [Marinifilum flexuosum]